MKVGAYQLCTLLSAGELGTRYYATDTRTDTPVEILLLRDDDTKAEAWRAMCKRWQTAALIESPVARRIETLGLDDEQPFVALEWLAGPTLFEHQSSAAELQPRESLGVIYEVSQCVSIAHRIGFVLIAVMAT